MVLKRILYLGYYLKKQDWQRLKRFQRYVKDQYDISISSQWIQVIQAVLKHNLSIEEWYQFRFWDQSLPERNTWAGTGFMYEYQLRMNPPEHRKVLVDKRIFLQKYGDYIQHQFITLSGLKESPEKARLLFEKSDKIVLKRSDGQCGRGIEIIPTKGLTPEELTQRLYETGNDFAEEFVVQHRDLMELSPSGLNTVRVITQLDHEDNVHVLGARLRITVNSPVDNLAAGNLAAPIELETGRVDGPGVYSDITKPDESTHPVTGVSIVGFQVPHWQETLKLCRKAALVDTRNRSIGWDVAITEKGPELIEGNHDWCKLLWQLPVKRGLKPVLEAFQGNS
jgi:hypothetical protein